MDVIEFRPERDQYAFTFGGVAPVRKVQPGTMLRLWTDDAFCGALRDPSDMPSAKLTMPFVNPQTGPFYVETAMPGDVLAVHFTKIRLNRDWAISDDFVVGRALDQLGVDNALVKRWGEG
jgi:acetamidase/formamidase